MDNYSLDEVKNIIENDNLSAYMLRSMLDNAIRRIELYSDEESIEILEYILKNAVISLEVKEEISKYLTNLSLEKESICNNRNFLNYCCNINLYIL